MNRVISGLILSLFAAGVGELSGQLPAARLTALHPCGARIGSTVEVALEGANLESAERMFFSHAGITAKPHADGRRFDVTVAAGTPAGIYSAWVAGHYGVSAPRAFHVGVAAEVAEAAGNHSFETARAVAVGSVVNGRADSESNDFYRVTLKRGQRLLVRCLDRELDSRMQGAVVVFDAARREVARSRLEGFAVHVAEADGDVYVRVNDFVYRGGGEYFYRLLVSVSEHVDHVLPLAVKPGEKTTMRVFGRSLTGGEASGGMMLEGQPLLVRSEELIAPPASAALPVGVALRDTHALLNTFSWRGSLIGFAEGEVVVEAEPNDSPDRAQSIRLPADISGRFHPARDRDWYAFEAKKGEVYEIEIISHRLHGLTDPLAVVQKASTKDGRTSYADLLVLNDAAGNFGGDEFDTFHHDASARLNIKEDGAYRIMIRDAFNSAVPDPRRVYRLIIRRPDPDFALVVQPISRRPEGDRRDVWAWNAMLRLGDVAGLKVLVFRRDGFSGDIDLVVNGLPDGVSYSPSRLTGSEKTAELFLRSNEGAKAWAGSLSVVGKATVGERRLERPARFASVNWDIDYDNSTTHMPDVRLADRLVLGICDEPAPLELSAGDGKTIEAETGSKVKIPVKVARRGEFGADLKVKPYGHAALAKIGDATIKGTSGEIVIDLGKYKLPVGSHALHLMTSSKGKYRPVPPELKAARSDLAKASSAAAPAEAHAKALAEVAAIKTLSAGQKLAVQREADEAAGAAKELAARRATAEKLVKDLEAKQKPRDVTADFYSMPFVLRVNPKK